MSRRVFWFQCTECKDTTEKVIHEDVNPDCGECGGDTNRLIGSPKFCSNTTGRSPALTTKAMNKPFGS